MPLFMATNRDKIYSVIVVMPLRSESVPVSHFGLFSEGYREEELAAAEAPLALERIELIVSGIIIGALVEDIAQRGREFQTFARIISSSFAFPSGVDSSESVHRLKSLKYFDSVLLAIRVILFMRSPPETRGALKS